MCALQDIASLRADHGEGLELLLNVVAILVLRVEVDLEELRPVDAAAGALAHHLRRSGASPEAGRRPWGDPR